MQGKLRLNSNGRWEIVDEFDKRIEITSGEVIVVYIGQVHLDGLIGGGVWLTTRIESGSRSEPPYLAEYYAVVPGIRLYNGMPARIDGY